MIKYYHFILILNWIIRNEQEEVVAEEDAKVEDILK